MPPPPPPRDFKIYLIFTSIGKEVVVGLVSISLCDLRGIIIARGGKIFFIVEYEHNN